MMQLFVVTGVHDYEGEDLLGVFSTREAAMTCRNKFVMEKEAEKLFGHDEFRIYPITLDDPDFKWLEAEYF
jgi:hypothetical protein